VRGPNSKGREKKGRGRKENEERGREEKEERGGNLMAFAGWTPLIIVITLVCWLVGSFVRYLSSL